MMTCATNMHIDQNKLNLKASILQMPYFLTSFNELISEGLPGTGELL
jgi:hypothetical protein